MKIRTEHTNDKSFKTPIIKREIHNGYIVPKTKPYKERSQAVAGYTTHFPLLNIMWNQKGLSKSDALKYNISTFSDRNGGSIMPAELAYKISEGKTLHSGSKFRSTQFLQDLKGQGVLAEISKPNYKRNIAAEAKVRKTKGLSRYIADAIYKIITTNIFTLYDEIDETFIVKVKIKNFYPNNPTLQENCQLEANLEATSYQALKDQKRAVEVVNDIKRRTDVSITQQDLRDAIRKFIPGIQPERREKAFNMLVGKLIKEGHKIKDYTVRGFGIEQEDGTIGDEEMDMNKDISDMGKTNTTNNTPNTQSQTLSTDSNYESSTTHPSPIGPTTLSPSALRHQASLILSADHASYLSTFNEALGLNLLSYVPSDDLDSRQLSVMNSKGALPFLYKTLSKVSPRVYGQGVDNLFYCRKEMRLHAMEGLGFMDVDLENCHAQIALALWGDKLPSLEAHLSKGSLWSSYEELYKEAGVKFHKSLIKAMHHATFLGGGTKAYQKAVNTYNNHHPDSVLSKEEYEAIVKVFISSPFYREVRSLFRWLTKEFDGKRITLPTGEQIVARKFRNLGRDKKTGVMKKDEGNMLTVIAGILQSIEVSIISYMIIKTHHSYVPILWQHDGLTIKALEDNVVEEMQKAVDEYCIPRLGRSIKLVGAHLS